MNEWTEERIDALRRLWLAGVSAKRIAAELGGLTRNAVMGKVDRVGLMRADRQPIKDVDELERVVRRVMDGRQDPQVSSMPTTAPAPVATTRPEPRPARVNADRVKTKDPVPSAIAKPDRVPKAITVEGTDRTVVAMPARPSGKVETGREGPVEIMALRDYMCKWPMGDPGSPEFRYCGQRSKGGTPYCEGHARLAYMPSKATVRSASSARR